MMCSVVCHVKCYKINSFHFSFEFSESSYWWMFWEFETHENTVANAIAYT